MLELLELSAEEVMAVIAQGLRADVPDLFDSDRNRRNIKSLTKAEASQIAGYEIIIKSAEAGDGHVDTVLKVKSIRFRLARSSLRVSPKRPSM